MDPFSRSTNGFEYGFERFQEPWMLNEAALLKILLSSAWPLQEQRPIKKLWLLDLL
jgi:hypothetical protein